LEYIMQTIHFNIWCALTSPFVARRPSSTETSTWISIGYLSPHGTILISSFYHTIRWGRIHPTYSIYDEIRKKHTLR
jgi:hypothetical protein